MTVPISDELRAWRWRRLQAQALLEPVGSVVEAASRSAGPAGGLPRGPLALAARVRGFRNDDLVAAVQTRALLRVPAMRGSVYLLPAALVPAGLALSAPNKVKATLARGGIDDRYYSRMADRIAAVLAGRELTGAEIRAAVSGDDALPIPGGELFTLVLRGMSHEGRIVRGYVSGGVASQVFAYARMDDWLGSPLEIPSQPEALKSLVAWYLDAHAPASARDFAWWAGVSAREAARAIAAADVRSVSVGVGSDEPMYATDAGLEGMARAPRDWESVVFIPHMDPYLMAHAERWLWLDPAWAPKVVAPSGDTTNVLLVDGEVRGVWDVADGMLRYACFGEPPSITALDAAARRLEGVFGHLRIERLPVPPDLARGGTRSFQAPFGPGRGATI